MVTRVHPGARWVHPGPLGSLGFALGVVRIISGRQLGSLDFAMGVVGFFLSPWVNSGWPWGSLGSSGVRGITPVGTGFRWVHPGTLGLIRLALGVIGFIQDRGVHSFAHWVSLGLSEVFGFTRFRPGDRSVHPGSLDSSADCGLTLVCSGGRWVHPESLGSLRYTLGVIGSSVVVGFTWIRPSGLWVNLEV